MQSELPQCLGGRGLDLKASSYAHHVNGPLLLNALLSILGQSQKRVHWDVRRCQKMPMMNAEASGTVQTFGCTTAVLSCWCSEHRSSAAQRIAEVSGAEPRACAPWRGSSGPSQRARRQPGNARVREQGLPCIRGLPSGLAGSHGSLEGMTPRRRALPVAGVP